MATRWSATEQGTGVTCDREGVQTKFPGDSIEQERVHAVALPKLNIFKLTRPAPNSCGERSLADSDRETSSADEVA